MKDIELLNQNFDQLKSEKHFELGSSKELPHIYILEDEDFLRTSLTKYLSKIYVNHRITAFVSTTEFIEELVNIEKGTPILLVTDMTFGENDIDGIAMVDYLKKLRYINFEVIMMTGFGSIETAISATKRGIFKYLTKPFSLDDMRNAVAECL